MTAKSFTRLIREAERDPAYWAERAILRVTEEICQAMDQRGITRAELSRRLDASPPYVTKILRGDANLTVESLARIALALGGEVKFHIAPFGMRTRWLDASSPAGRTVATSTSSLSFGTRSGRRIGTSLATPPAELELTFTVSLSGAPETADGDATAAA